MDPNTNPETLQNKVQWDLRFYFARRANENIDKFTKGTFQLKKHEESGLRYIEKCYDEQTKNHQMDQGDIQTACMVEVPESKFCPVKSFLKYLSHLSPLITDFWQYQKTKNWQDSDVWYTNKKIGFNPLSSFMSRISHDADLSQVCTNHSIRVTGTTYLTRKQFTPKQIMSVTGHKSLNSLAIYQKVSTDEKLSMAYAMSCYLQNENSLPLQIGPTAKETEQQDDNQTRNAIECETVGDLNQAKNSTISLQENTNVQNQLVPYENEDPFADSEIPDFDLGQIMETIEKENNRFSMTQTAGYGASTMTSFMQQRTEKKSSDSNF